MYQAYVTVNKPASAIDKSSDAQLLPATPVFSAASNVAASAVSPSAVQSAVGNVMVSKPVFTCATVFINICIF